MEGSKKEEKVLSLRDQVISILAALKTPLGPAKLGIKNSNELPQLFMELQICSNIALVDETKRIADLLEKRFGNNSTSVTSKNLEDLEKRLKRLKND